MTPPFGDSVVTCLVKKVPIPSLISCYLTNNEIREGYFMQGDCLLVCVCVSSEKKTSVPTCVVCFICSDVQTHLDEMLPKNQTVFSIMEYNKY